MKSWNLAYRGQKKLGLYEKNMQSHLFEPQKSRLARGEYKIQPIYGLTGKIFKAQHTERCGKFEKFLFTVTALSLTLVIRLWKTGKEYITYEYFRV